MLTSLSHTGAFSPDQVTNAVPVIDLRNRMTYASNAANEEENAIHRPQISDRITETKAISAMTLENEMNVHFIIEIIISHPEAVIIRNWTSLSISKDLKIKQTESGTMAANDSNASAGLIHPAIAETEAEKEISTATPADIIDLLKSL